MLKIAITGPESSGKSTLTQYLASHFGVPYVPEFAREYLSHSSGAYKYEDLEHIFAGQILLEQQVAADSNRGMMFCDTDVLVIRIWSIFRFGKVAQKIEDTFRSGRYNHYLLCRPDIPWVPDSFRESPLQEERNRLFELYLESLHEINASFTVIEGSFEKRVEKAIGFIAPLVQN